MYGVTRSVAELVDGHKGAPNGPLCTATICTFAATYFDRGIQHWVSRLVQLVSSVSRTLYSIVYINEHQCFCRYCYDRIGGKHTNLTKESFASLITFVVVAIWQGLGIQVIVWAILNCIGLTFEFFISQLLLEDDKEYTVSPSNVRTKNPQSMHFSCSKHQPTKCCRMNDFCWKLNWGKCIDCQSG